jgi:transposase
MNILAIDLGKFKSVACLFNTKTNEAEFETISTYRWAIQQLLEQTRPDRVVLETCSISG